MKSSLMRGLGIGALLTVALSLQPNAQLLTTVAQAQTSVSASIDFGTFYTGLSSYGTWTSFDNQYVWVPGDIDARWRPYSRGHWAATDDYGWIWVSDEPFGWATYHYGRWGYDDAIGWYWVPGHRWAPAWVAWSRNDEDVAWAPLPPRTNDRDNVSIDISVGDVPDYYWQAVPARSFLSINFSNDFIRDRGRVHSIVQGGQPGTVVIQNNIVVNNAIDPAFIEQRTGGKVDRVKVDVVTSPDQITKAGTAKIDTVTIFNGEVKGQADAKPQAVEPPDEIASDRKAKGIQPLDKSGQDAGGTASKQDNSATPPASTNENNNTTVVPKQNNNTTTLAPPKTPTNDTTKTDLNKNTTIEQNAPTATDQNTAPQKATVPTDKQLNGKKMKKVPTPSTGTGNTGGVTTEQPPAAPNKKLPPDTNGADSKMKPAKPIPPAAPSRPSVDAKTKVPAPPPSKADQNNTIQKNQTAAPPAANPPKDQAQKPAANGKQPEKPKAACDPQTQKCD